jgi:hypothetical protein
MMLYCMLGPKKNRGIRSQLLFHLIRLLSGLMFCSTCMPYNDFNIVVVVQVVPTRIMSERIKRLWRTGPQNRANLQKLRMQGQQWPGSQVRGHNLKAFLLP